MHWSDIGAWINWKLVAGSCVLHTEYNNNALTLPDYFTGRFEDKTPHFAHYLRYFGYFAVLHHLCASGHCGRRASCLKVPLA